MYTQNNSPKLLIGRNLVKPYRTLADGQSCQVWIHDISTGTDQLIHETRDRLLEAPNWTLQNDALILNGDGVLWRLELETSKLIQLEIDQLPPVNNDHVLDPDGEHIFISTNVDWQIYRAPLAGGTASQVTGKCGPQGLRNFLHGVSPDGCQLAFVGVQVEQSKDVEKFVSAEIFLIGADGQDFQQVTHAGVPADGPEYSPDGQWIYFNTEAFSGHAQIARMRPNGSELSRLTFSKTVDWFPHFSPDGSSAMFLAYPEGTVGHPADKWVNLMIVENDAWDRPRKAVKLFGGQGTVNVNSWSPDNHRFAYVAYPID